MSPTIENAIKTLSSAVNISTGLNHPNDMNKARELFDILHKNGEVLLKSEIADYAISHGWRAADADELGSLAQQIGEGKPSLFKNGPWWAADIYQKLTA
jgi:hypothetical protein